MVCRFQLFYFVHCLLVFFVVLGRGVGAEWVRSGRGVVALVRLLCVRILILMFLFFALEVFFFSLGTLVRER